MSPVLIDFANTNGADITEFKKCAEETDSVISQIKGLYSVPPFSPDEDMVVYGSIARYEAVDGSDIDWTLLVDGQANPQHLTMASEVRKKLKASNLKDPGTSGLFGQISFSHELIHNIGGQADTNHNLTKRILLLLESAKISFGGNQNDEGTAYDRIIKGILSQYIEHDSGLNSNHSSIPRFLLNDIVRYWRTMCVDFAYKQKEQEGEKWALRNIKLRTSRKLLYVKGLLMCFSQFQNEPNKANLISELCEKVKYTPIELLIKLKEHFNLEIEPLVNIINCYNDFLCKLGDNQIRNNLEKLPMHDVYENQVFNDLRMTADRLQESLTKLFIETEGPLKALTIKYGIF